MRGIQCLVVNAYNASEVGKAMERYAFVMKMVLSLLGSESLIHERNVHELEEFVLDWENEQMVEATKSKAKRFDKLDLVVVAGDSKFLPWDPRAHSLTVLLHMCNFVQKPVFCSGGGAFHGIYSLATQGARFNMINGPLGDRLERLPNYPRFAEGTEVFPSGFLDSETGDVYRYKQESKAWKPSCSLGMNRRPASGTPVRPGDGFNPPPKVNGRDKRPLKEQARVEALDGDEDIVQVRQLHSQHYLLHKVTEPKFALPIPDEWYLNTEGGLPPREGLTVIADGTHGPVLLTYDNVLVLSAVVKQGRSYDMCRQILKNFLRGVITRLQSAAGEEQEPVRLLERLFGKGGVGECQWTPIAQEDREISRPLASSLVPTRLALGPERVSAGPNSPRASALAGAEDVVPQHGAADDYDYEALTSPRGHTTLGKKVPVAKQRDGLVRRKRLDIFLGHPEMQAINKKAHVLAEKMAKSKKLRGVVPREDPEALSVRKLLGEDLLEPPAMKQKELFTSLQTKPPRIKLVRPDTAERAAKSRWNKKNADAPEEGRGGVAYDKFTGEQVSPAELPWARHSAPAHFEQNPVLEATTRTQKEGYLPHSHPTRKVRVPENYVSERDKVLQREEAKRAKDDKKKRDRKSKSNAATEEAPEAHEQPRDPNAIAIVPTVVMAGVDAPFNNRQKFQQLQREDKWLEEHPAEFKGTFTEEYRSEHEKIQHEYTESKKKFIAGPFVATFDKMSSVPLRKASVLGPPALEEHQTHDPDQIGPTWRNY